MKRLAAASAAVVASAVLTWGTPPAHAVGNRDLPSAGQVERVVGGEVTRATSALNSVEKFSQCRKTGSTSGDGGRSGRFVGGRSAYFVLSGVVEARSARQARTMVRGWQRLRRCETVTLGGGTFTVKRAVRPGRQVQGVGLRLENSADAKLDVFVARKGRKVVLVSVNWKHRASLKHSRALLRVAYRKA